MTGKNVKAAKASKPYRAADYLNAESDVTAYLQAALENGEARVITIALRDVADASGGIGELARKTGLSRETLYRTLSPRGNPRLDTLATLLRAFHLRLTVEPVDEAA